MPVLPVPMIIALVLLGLLVQRLLARETHPLLLALIGGCALQSALVASVQYYGLASLKPVQPVFAAVIPGLAWLAFAQASTGRVRPAGAALHLIGPALALLCVVLAPEGLDIVIPALFASYGFAITLMLGRGEESLPHSRLENGGLPVLVWRVVALALIASALSDSLIAVSLAVGNTGPLLWLPSVLSSVTLLVLGLLGLSHSIESESPPDQPPSPYEQEEKARDEEILQTLDAHIEANKPYLDPDLTLSRLARQVLIPEKQISAAVNKRRGENVSRYINNHRVLHASALLRDGKSVTDAMLASGFNTKSNFNREFLRVQGSNPRLWLKSAAEGPGGSAARQ